MKMLFITLRKIYKSMALVGFLAIAPYAWANNTCIEISSDLDRLTCFDEKHGTPRHLQFKTDLSVVNEKTKKPPYWVESVYEVESQRPVGMNDFLVTTLGDMDNQIVRLSHPSQGSYTYDPILVISCVDNITRLQIVLKKQIENNTVEVAISNKSGPESFFWKVSDDGYVISAGRGLYSINIIKNFFTKTDIEVNLADAAIGKVHFDINGLSDHIKTLRETCHW